MKLIVRINRLSFFVLLGTILTLAGIIYVGAITNPPFEIKHSWTEFDGKPTISCLDEKVISSINLDTGQPTCSDIGLTSVNTGEGISGGGSSGNLEITANINTLQKRVSGSCSSGKSIRAIDVNGGVTCESDSLGIEMQSKTCTVNGNCNFGFSPEFIYLKVSEWTQFESYADKSTFIIQQGETIDICYFQDVNTALCPIFPGDISLQGNNLVFGEYHSWALEVKIIAYSG